MIDTTFTVNIDGKDTEFEIKTTTFNEQRESNKIYNQTFSDAIKSGSIVRARLDDLLTEQGLWDDKKQLRFVTIQKQLSDKDKILSKGGISLKQAKVVALEMRQLRDELRELISVKTNLDTHTAEGQADNARFNYLVSVSVVYKDTKKPYFSSYDDYLNRSIDPVALTGAQKLGSLMYGLDNDYEKKLPENKFLIKYKLVNNNLELVDDKGSLVDAEGRLVDANGRFINEQGKFVDKDGNLVDDSGEYIVDFQPFLDEDGKPINLDNNDAKTELSQETSQQS
jgi:hypothetical protein